ncbi:uncharacterized protein LOC112685587 [Sipha flava]|uniref:Uncharacterized protein LOC112685587 n=1 Tax=Sipha flava TaxID=143950 RepID=A0A2S2PZI3_9HEMI|nr:uncharacterized protein LOC112685587 [Sipha flava]
MSFPKMVCMLLIWNIFDNIETSSIINNQEESPDWLLNWDTEIRVCGPSFYHLMGNLCNTTNIELDYKEMIVEVHTLATKCCKMSCLFMDIKGLCIDSNLNDNYLRIPKNITKSVEPNDTMPIESVTISISDQKKFISTALDKILQVFL